MAVQRTLPAKQITLNMALAVDSISFDAVRVALNLVANMQRLEMTARFFIQRLEQSGISEQRRQTVSKIDYQALREAAEKATWGDWDSYKPHRGARGYEVRLSSQAIAQHVLKNNAEFIAAFNPKIALALLDERERNQQYIKSRDQENEDIALTVGKLRVELEETKSKLNEQREYYEGVISDGSKRIAELEKSEEQLISERDHAESALADMYFAATGDRPEWSNLFGFSDAVDAEVDRIADLEAIQPSPVVPEGLIKAVRFYEQVKRENPQVETGAWKDAVDWVLKEACQAVNIGIKGE